MARRFRGFLPVVVDIETGGINPSVHALLEIGAVFLEFDTSGQLVPCGELHYHLTPAEGTKLDKSSLEFTKIDPYHPLRFAVSEQEALTDLFGEIREKVNEHTCQRAIMVAHNAWFDLHALAAAAHRSKVKDNPFHSFSSIDTASLGALLCGQTVLARICHECDIELDPEQAHSALYDAQITARLFCTMVNAYHNAIVA